MAEPEIYYYLRRMDEDLQDELKPQLSNSINLDSSTSLKGSLSPTPRVALIHASQRNNADLKNKLKAINLDLILFLIQGAGKPKEAQEKIKQEFPDVQRSWECGTEYLIQHFAEFEKYLKTNSVGNWSPQGWVVSDLKLLSALAILCQGYLALYATDDGRENEKLAAVEEQLNWIDRGLEVNLSALSKNLSHKKELVCQVSWWLNVFGLWDEKNQKIFLEKWIDFKRDLAQEWGAATDEQFPEALTQLLKAMQESPAELRQPKRVTDAYEAIAPLLESQLRH